MVFSVRAVWQLLVLLGLGFAFTTSASAQFTLPKPTQVAPHVWVWIGPYDAPSTANRGYRMNLGFVQGADGVAVIDSGYSPEMAEAMLRHIRAITARPVRYVINTNSQPHRFMGNDVFRAAGAETIAAREAATRMENEGAAFAQTVARTLQMRAGSIRPPAPPQRLIDAGQTITLDLGGGVTLDVKHFGRAHTRGSLVVAVAPDATVFAGDILYSGRLPSLLSDSHTAGWIAAYDALRDLGACQFVPGHGKVAPLAAFEHPTYQYLTRLKRHMDDAIKQGHGVDAAIARFDAGPWKKLAVFNELAGRNASLAYLEAEAEGF